MKRAPHPQAELRRALALLRACRDVMDDLEARVAGSYLGGRPFVDVEAASITAAMQEVVRAVLLADEAVRGIEYSPESEARIARMIRELPKESCSYATHLKGVRAELRQREGSARGIYARQKPIVWVEVDRRRDAGQSWSRIAKFLRITPRGLLNRRRQRAQTTAVSKKTREDPGVFR